MSEKWDKYFLGMAQYVSLASKDPSTKVGSVITDPLRRVVSVGYNGFARGVRDDRERYEDRETKLRLVIHAEMNSLLFANRELRGCDLYVTPMMPCANCAAAIIQTGISRVVSLRSSIPRWKKDFLLSEQMFREAGVELVLYGEEKE